MVDHRETDHLLFLFSPCLERSINFEKAALGVYNGTLSIVPTEKYGIYLVSAVMTSRLFMGNTRLLIHRLYQKSSNTWTSMLFKNIVNAYTTHYLRIHVGKGSQRSLFPQSFLPNFPLFKFSISKMQLRLKQPCNTLALLTSQQNRMRHLCRSPLPLLSPYIEYYLDQNRPWQRKLLRRALRMIGLSFGSYQEELVVSTFIRLSQAILSNIERRVRQAGEKARHKLQCAKILQRRAN